VGTRCRLSLGTLPTEGAATTTIKLLSHISGLHTKKQKPKVLKAAKDAVPPDRGHCHLDFGSEGTENTNGTRGDHGCGLSGAQATAQKAVFNQANHFDVDMATTRASTFEIPPFGGGHTEKLQREASKKKKRGSATGQQGPTNHSAQLASERQWGIGHTSPRTCVLACAVPLYNFRELILDLAWRAEVVDYAAGFVKYAFEGDPVSLSWLKTDDKSNKQNAGRSAEAGYEQQLYTFAIFFPSSL
jgi:hypothetical protein